MAEAEKRAGILGCVVCNPLTHEKKKGAGRRRETACIQLESLWITVAPHRSGTQPYFPERARLCSHGDHRCRLSRQEMHVV